MGQNIYFPVVVVSDKLSLGHIKMLLQPEPFKQNCYYMYQMTIAFIRHTFDGIRELKINSKENFFSNSLKKTLSRYASIGVTRSIITVLPRITMEVILVFLFTFGIYILITLDYEYEKIVLSLPIYAAAAFRMLPNLNSMIRSYQKMTYTKI